MHPLIHPNIITILVIINRFLIILTSAFSFRMLFTFVLYVIAMLLIVYMLVFIVTCFLSSVFLQNPLITIPKALLSFFSIYS